MKSSTKAALGLIISSIIVVGLAVLFAHLLSSCAQVAHVSDPTAVYNTVSAAEYDAAEANFSGAAPVLFPVVEYWNDARCQELLDKRDAYMFVSTTLGGFAGVGGTTAGFLNDDEQKGWKIGSGLTSLASGILSASFAGAATAKTKRFEQYCNTTIATPAAVELALMPNEFTSTDAGL